jgi:cytochrome c556
MNSECFARLQPATLLVTAFLAACSPADAESEARFQELEQRFTPGLHALMADLGVRHASLWFAGEAGNWPLTGYMVHEIQELIEDIEALHPVYRDVQVAAMLREMTMPAVEALEDAVEAGDGAAFADAYDRFTTACNHCHTASDRGFLVVRRPTSPPLTNLRFEP